MEPGGVRSVGGLHVRRANPSVHPIRGDELRMLTALRKQHLGALSVATSERTPDAINRLGKDHCKASKFGSPRPFHMFEHYDTSSPMMGSTRGLFRTRPCVKSSTPPVPALSPARFKDFWRD